MLFVFTIGIVFATNAGIDADKPRFQHRHVGDVVAAIIIFGSLLLWAVSAAWLIWRKSVTGWFLALTFDVLVFIFGIAMFSENIQRMLHGGSLFRFSTGLFDWDSIYYLALITIPAAALCLLFTSPMRRYFSSHRVR